MDDVLATLRHNILGELTVIKNALAFVIEGQTGTITDETKKFLREAYDRNEKVINTVMATKEKTNG